MGVIIHHLDGNANNNIYDNLAVLCLSCHDQAHTSRKLTRNLRPEHISDFKEEWREVCRKFDVYVRRVSLAFPTFYWFNVPWLHRYYLQHTGRDVLREAGIGVKEGEAGPFLFEGSSSLPYQGRIQLTVILEKIAVELASSWTGLSLDDVIMLESHHVPVATEMVYFYHDFFSKGLPPSVNDVGATYRDPARLHRTFQRRAETYRVELSFDPRYLVSTTSFVNLTGHTIVRGFGQFLGAVKSASKIELRVRPLALGASGVSIDEPYLSAGQDYALFKELRANVVAFAKSPV